MLILLGSDSCLLYSLFVGAPGLRGFPGVPGPAGLKGFAGKPGLDGSRGGPVSIYGTPSHLD